MANPNPKTAHLKKWQPGQSGNPGGKPKWLLTGVKVSSVIGRLWDKTRGDLESLIENPESPIGDVMIASIMLTAAKLGDANRLNALLDRAIGKVKDAPPLETPSEFEDMAPEDRARIIDELIAKRNGNGATDASRGTTPQSPPKA